MKILSVENLSRSFGGIKANNDISFEVAEGTTAQDRHAAEILGIPSDKMFAIGWAIGLGCVGVAGGMMANYFFIFTDVGINFALFAFVAVALGGFGSIIGCLYAGIIIGLVESLGGLLIDPSFKLLYVFAIYLLVVIFRPQGLFGRY